jgi:hypothetical protein
VKKQSHQKRPPLTLGAKKDLPPIAGYYAQVPVKVTVIHADAILLEYEEAVTLTYTDSTEEGKRNIFRTAYLTTHEAVSFDDALFNLASKVIETRTPDEHLKKAAVQLNPPYSLDVSIFVTKTGNITYDGLT